MSERFRLAIPNKGRLQEPTGHLLRNSGMVFEQTNRALAVPVRNAPIDLLFVRTDDIVELVMDGVADAGITGYDILAESEAPLEVLAELGYGRCRLSGAVPMSSDVDDLSGFEGLRVATSHPKTTARFFEDKSISVTTVPLRGSVEVAPRLDVADAIVDLVSSGSTLLVNGLREVATVLESQAVLVADPRQERDRDQLTRVTTMLRAVVAGRRKRYVLMNAPATAVEAIEDIIPGLEAPSVVPLAHNGMVAVHSVVDADHLWDVLPKLETAGATGILVLPIEAMIP